MSEIPTLKELKELMEISKRHERLNLLKSLLGEFQKLQIEKGLVLQNAYVTFPKAISLCLKKPLEIVEEYIDYNKEIWTYEIGELHKSKLGHLVVVM